MQARISAMHSDTVVSRIYMKTLTCFCIRAVALIHNNRPKEKRITDYIQSQKSKYLQYTDTPQYIYSFSFWLGASRKEKRWKKAKI